MIIQLCFIYLHQHNNHYKVCSEKISFISSVGRYGLRSDLPADDCSKIWQIIYIATPTLAYACWKIWRDHARYM